jgi:hypothetical protein
MFVRHIYGPNRFTPFDYYISCPKYSVEVISMRWVEMLLIYAKDVQQFDLHV